MSFSIDISNDFADIPRVVEGLVLPPEGPVNRRYTGFHIQIVIDLDFFPGEPRRVVVEREFGKILEKCFPLPKKRSSKRGLDVPKENR